MQFAHGFCSETHREYTVRYPSRRVPNAQVFTWLRQRFVNRESVHKEQSKVGAAALDVYVQEQIFWTKLERTRRLVLGILQLKTARVKLHY